MTAILAQFAQPQQNQWGALAAILVALLGAGGLGGAWINQHFRAANLKRKSAEKKEDVAGAREEKTEDRLWVMVVELQKGMQTLNQQVGKLEAQVEQDHAAKAALWAENAKLQQDNARLRQERDEYRVRWETAVGGQAVGTLQL